MRSGRARWASARRSWAARGCGARSPRAATGGRQAAETSGPFADRSHFGEMALAQLDLFAPAAVVPGLRVAGDFLDPAEEDDLIARLAGEALAPFKFQGWEGKRLTTSFG